MCGLFGFSTYQEKVAHDLTKLTNSLAKQFLKEKAMEESRHE